LEFNVPFQHKYGYIRDEKIYSNENIKAVVTGCGEQRGKWNISSQRDCRRRRAPGRRASWSSSVRCLTKNQALSGESTAPSLRYDQLLCCTDVNSGQWEGNAYQCITWGIPAAICALFLTARR